MAASACPGEFEPFGALVATSAPVRNVRVAMSALTGPDGVEIAHSHIDLRLVKRLFVRTHYSRPPEDIALRSRYLLPNEPFDMPTDTFRRIHAIVRVPDDARPGMYRGTLSVSVNAKPVRHLPVELRVLGLQLASPAKHYALYYRRQLTPDSEELVRRELTDIRAHGADRLLWHPRIDYRKDGDNIRTSYEDVAEQLAMMQELGFVGPYIVLDGFERLSQLTDGEEGPQFLGLARRSIEGLIELGRERGWPELVVHHMDEVFGHDRLDRYVRLARAVRQVPEARLYITFHNRPGVEHFIQAIDPYVDIRCYHGHSMDEWLSAGHTFADLATELRAAGDEAWCYYNPREIAVNAEWARICNGFWLWLTPITTHCPWAYNSYWGHPLDDEDGYDYGYAFPVDDKIVPTRMWEGYREGIDDMRYLSTLEQCIREAEKHGRSTKAVTTARAWLDGLRDTLLSLPLDSGQSALVRAIAQRFCAHDYNEWRIQCAQHIALLREEDH